MQIGLDPDRLVGQARRQAAILRQPADPEHLSDGSTSVWRRLTPDLLGEDNSGELEARRLAAWQPEQAHEHLRVVRLQRLLDLDDERFVDHAYWTVLHRPPDPPGKEHFLEHLRSGGLGKIEILAALRFSPEGRRAGVRIKGLLLHYFAAQLYRAPVFGVLARWLVALVRLPTVISNLDRERARFSRVSAELEKSSLQLSKSAEEHFSEIDEALEKLRTFEEIPSDWPTTAAPPGNDSSSKTAPDSGIEHRGWATTDYYARLESRFRGDQEAIRADQAKYLEYLPPREFADGRIVDLGCGRGEWLADLDKAGYSPIGVDTNVALTSEAEERRLDIRHQDAIEFLRQSPDGSMAAITAFHLVEHMDFGSLVELLVLCHRAIAPAGILILETPNPETLIVGACNFYLDPTHHRPLPPLLLEYAVKDAGFGNTEVLRLHPSIEPDRWEGLKDHERLLLDRAFGPQDYAIIAQKV